MEPPASPLSVEHISRSNGGWWREHRIDVALLVLVTLAAALPRLVLLADVPPGLHGDEAVTAELASQILDDGPIGVYTHEIAGSPTGPMYWTAAVFAVGGDSPLAIRWAFALLAVATVSIAFLAFRVMFDRSTATIACLLLAGFAWHLHYSRIALTPIMLPFTEVATVFLLFLAIRKQSYWLFGAAGAGLASGLYTYKSYPVYAIAMALVLGWVGLALYRHRARTFVSQMAVMLAVAFVVGLPMARFAYDDPAAYKSQGPYHDVTESEAYKDAGMLEKGRLLVNREVDFIRSFIDEPAQLDGVDAAGVMPFLNRIWLVLVIIGGGIALWRIDKPEYATVLIIIGVFSVLPAWYDGAWYRRTFAMTPFLALIAALPLAALWKEAGAIGGRATVAAMVVVGLTLAGSAALDLTRYFTTYDDHPLSRYVFKADIHEAYDFINDLPEGTFVNFYSRFGVDQVDHFLVTDVEGDNRAGPLGSAMNPWPNPTRDHAFVFTDSSIPLADEIEEQLPGGERVDRGDLFQAYLLPRSVEPGP